MNDKKYQRFCQTLDDETLERESTLINEEMQTAFGEHRSELHKKSIIIREEKRRRENNSL